VTDDRLAHNLDVVAVWLVDDWTKWLFQCFREKNYQPLRFSPRSTITSEIEDLFENSPEDVRYRMKRSLVDSLRMWDEGFYGLEVLRELAWTAGKLRAVHVVAVLLKILLDNRERMSWGNPFFDTADILLGVVAGFAVDEPDKRIETAFDGLFCDPEIAPHFSSLLALGISICNPSRFVESFNRFVVQAAAADSYFVGADVFAQFADHLTIKLITDNIYLLSPAARDFAWRSGVDAGLLVPSDITGVREKIGQSQPKREPLRPMPVADLYDIGRDDLKTATNLFKRAGKSVLDMTYARGRTLRQNQLRGRA
jgi:hypothetical protein